MFVVAAVVAAVVVVVVGGGVVSVFGKSSFLGTSVLVTEPSLHVHSYEINSKIISFWLKQHFIQQTLMLLLLFLPPSLWWD